MKIIVSVCLLLLALRAQADDSIQDQKESVDSRTICKEPQLDSRLYMHKATKMQALAMYEIDTFHFDECRAMQQLIQASVGKVPDSEIETLIRYWKFRVTHITNTYKRDVNDLTKLLRAASTE